jgi:chromosomal replication initiation ATPase DnaA
MKNKYEKGREKNLPAYNYVSNILNRKGIDTVDLELLNPIFEDITGFSMDEITGGSRLRHLVIARQTYHFLAVYFAKKSLKKMGAIGNRDHATIIHSLEQVEELFEFSPPFATYFKTIIILTFEKYDN